MIVRTLVIALLLFLGYNLYLIFAHPATGKGQHQWQKNIIEAQEYIYEHQGTPNVLVGSSLTFRVDNTMLPEGYYNLSLGGGSIFTGLDIISRCEKKPETVYIETNFIIRPGDEKIIESLFRPIVSDAKENLPALKEKNQPVNLLLPLFTRYSAKKSPAAPATDSVTFKKLLQRYIHNHQTLPDTVLLAENIALLKQKISQLKSQGVDMVFYEMPVHCSLLETPQTRYMRAHIKKAFPETEYTWLPEPDCNAYTYNDGEHLSYASAVKFAGWFVGMAESRLPAAGSD